MHAGEGQGGAGFLSRSSNRSMVPAKPRSQKKPFFSPGPNKVGCSTPLNAKSFPPYSRRCLSAPALSPRSKDGKVCLSLLGTWEGPSWDPGSSTLLQASLEGKF